MTLLSSQSLICDYHKVFVQESYQQAVGKSVSWQLYSPLWGSRTTSVACIAAGSVQVGPRPFDRCMSGKAHTVTRVNVMFIRLYKPFLSHLALANIQAESRPELRHSVDGVIVLC